MSYVCFEINGNEIFMSLRSLIVRSQIHLNKREITHPEKLNRIYFTCQLYARLCQDCKIDRTLTCGTQQ